MSAEAETTSATPRCRAAWCAKMIEYFRSSRNRISPGVVELPDCDFFNVAPRRTLRVLRPELKSERFYEPPTPRERPESINDNFYSRWARRPHPSGNCRCSFRQSTNSSRLSSHEEQIISQEIQRIRSSLCEAEKTGRDIEELEKSLSVDLITQLQAETDRAERCVAPAPTVPERNLEEHAKSKIVKDLDRYISDLLDEILNDTIRAIARAERPFNRESSSQSATFDISFAFHNSDDAQQDQVGPQSKSQDKAEDHQGYVNRGFVGSASDPDALDFHLRRRLNGDAILENVDSGINSVETVELQAPEQEQNLEQSLIDIIDAKLGGTSIGKSLEDLGMDIDATDDAKVSPAREQVSVEVENQTTIPEKKLEVAKAEDHRKRVTTKGAAPVDSPADRTSKSLDDVIEEPFNSLRLEFKRNSQQRPGSSNNNKDTDDPKPAAAAGSNVTSRVNKTVSVIRKRIATRLRANSRRKPGKKKKSVTANNNNNNNNNNNSASNNETASSKSSKSKSSTRSSLELEDYRRRFPVPETNRRQYFKPVDDEVTLRNRSRKPMIVFLHGFGSSAEAFEQQLRYFADLGYPCIAPDLLGHGMSSAPNRRADYQFGKLLNDIETLLLHYAFKPGQKCVLVAHNYGCSFATALANKYTSNVHQLVLISGGGPTPLAPPLTEGPGHCCLRASLAPLLVCGMNRAVLYSARGRQHPYCGGELLPEQWPSHMRYVLQGMTWPDGDYVFHRRICTPTLLVHGLRDNKVSLVQECQMERTMIKAFLEAIPAAGHMPMTDCPEQLNHMIHCFIDLWKNKKW